MMKGTTVDLPPPCSPLPLHHHMHASARAMTPDGVFVSNTHLGRGTCTLLLLLLLLPDAATR
jgi:hypothetical protein